MRRTREDESSSTAALRLSLSPQEACPEGVNIYCGIYASGNIIASGKTLWVYSRCGSVQPLKEAVLAQSLSAVYYVVLRFVAERERSPLDRWIH